MINKIKNTLMLITGILTAIVFYGNKKKKEGIKEEQNKIIEKENIQLKKNNNLENRVNNMSSDEIDINC